MCYFLMEVKKISPDFSYITLLEITLMSHYIFDSPLLHNNACSCYSCVTIDDMFVDEDRLRTTSLES